MQREILQSGPLVVQENTRLLGRRKPGIGQAGVSFFGLLGLAQELLGILLLAPRPAGEARATSYTRGGM